MDFFPSLRSNSLGVVNVMKHVVNCVQFFQSFEPNVKFDRDKESHRKFGNPGRKNDSRASGAVLSQL